MTNVSISKILQMIFNWFEPKNIQLRMLLETFIWPLICGHPQDHSKLRWKPCKNWILLSHIIIVIVLLHVFTPLSLFLRHLFPVFLFLYKYHTCLNLFHVTFLLISVINTFILDMFTFDFICSTTLISIQVREHDIQTYIKEIIVSFIFDFYLK